MKKLIIVCLALTSYFVNAQEKNLNWLTDFDTAKVVSEETNKPILMYFTGSDWCAPCKMLKEDFFLTEEFKERAKNLILVEVDWPRNEDKITAEQRKRNNFLIQSYNQGGSFPTLVALDHKGNSLGSLSAYSALRDPSNHFNFVDTIIKKF